MVPYLNIRKGISLGALFAFLLNAFGPLPFAQADDFYLPMPGVMVHLSPEFNPPILKGIKVHPDNPFRFDFILDKGDSELDNNQLKNESSRLIKYFLASLTVPEKDLWVNLSPYEKDRIVPESFGQTGMGRDLLAEDYMLKQITASLIYPEDETGKKFWKRIYQESAKKFGTTNIPINTFNKVWIVPDKAVMYENAKAGTAYVVESRLRVMLEQDYLALSKKTLDGDKETSTLGSQIIREIVIPELTREVNTGKNFYQLRQVYNSLILATWYKKKIKDSILSLVYADKNRIAGVNVDDPREKEKIYQQYLKAFKKGVYNYIKEDTDLTTQQTIPRKYFSGGVDFNFAMASDKKAPRGINGLMTDTAVIPGQTSPLSVISVTVVEEGNDLEKEGLKPSDRAMIDYGVEKRVNRSIKAEQVAVLNYNSDTERGLILKALGALHKSYFELTEENLAGTIAESGDWLNIIVAPGNIKFTSDDQLKSFLKMIRLPVPKGVVLGDINALSKNQDEYLSEFVRAHVDHLTKLNNINGLVLEVYKLIKDRISRPGKVRFKWANIDVDHLGAVTDLWEHSQSNDVIIATARALEASAGPEEITSHIYGGDEFAILMPVTTGQKDRPKQVFEDVRKKIYRFLPITRKQVIAELKRKHGPDAYNGMIYQLALQNPIRGQKRSITERALKRRFKTLREIAKELENPQTKYKFEGWLLTFTMAVIDFDENKTPLPRDPDDIRTLIDHLYKQADKNLKTHKLNSGKDGIFEEPYKNPAMITHEKPLIMSRPMENIQKNGGIDLTPAHMNLQLQNSNGQIQFHLDPAMLKQLQNAPGFVPVIINIQPMVNLALFLGASPAKK